MKTTFVTVSAEKGGVRKTTPIANLEVALAEGGQTMVCNDGDSGLRNLEVENRIIYEMVVAFEGRFRLKQAMLCNNQSPDSYMITAAQTWDKSVVCSSDMACLCSDSWIDAEWIIIDSPAEIERGFRNVNAPADIDIVVTRSEVSAVRDTVGLLA